MVLGSPEAAKSISLHGGSHPPCRSWWGGPHIALLFTTMVVMGIIGRTWGPSHHEETELLTGQYGAGHIVPDCAGCGRRALRVDV